MARSAPNEAALAERIETLVANLPDAVELFSPVALVEATATERGAGTERAKKRRAIFTQRHGDPLRGFAAKPVD